MPVTAASNVATATTTATSLSPYVKTIVDDTRAMIAAKKIDINDALAIAVAVARLVAAGGVAHPIGVVKDAIGALAAGAPELSAEVSAALSQIATSNVLDTLAADARGPLTSAVRAVTAATCGRCCKCCAAPPAVKP